MGLRLPGKGVWGALDDGEQYPDKSGDDYKALKRLYKKINLLHKRHTRMNPDRYDEREYNGIDL